METRDVLINILESMGIWPDPYSARGVEVARVGYTKYRDNSVRIFDRYGLSIWIQCVQSEIRITTGGGLGQPSGPMMTVTVINLAHPDSLKTLREKIEKFR